MKLYLMEKLANEHKLNLNKPFCDECYVNLVENIEQTGNDMTIYRECPACHKQWIIECDKKGYMVSARAIESK